VKDTLGDGAVARLAPGALGATLFAIVFFGVAHALGSEELATVVAAVSRRRSRGLAS
jgi:hypothetical protein